LAAVQIYSTLFESFISLRRLDTWIGFRNTDCETPSSTIGVPLPRADDGREKPRHLTHLRHTGKFSPCCPPHPSAMEIATTSAGSVLHDLKDSKEPIIACDLGW
jgi:hypothetical protein